MGVLDLLLPFEQLAQPGEGIVVLAHPGAVFLVLPVGGDALLGYAMHLAGSDLRFEPTDTGYLMLAYGVVNGEACAERPQVIIADGRRRPLLDLSGRPIPGVPTGAMTFGSKPDPQTLELGEEVDGQVLGAGRYKVSADGKTLTVTNKGTGLKGPFEVVMVMERVVR